MSIVSGNDPEPSEQQRRGIGCGWIVPLVLFGPTIYRYIRSAAAGRITDQQLLIIIGGVVALIALVVIVRRVNQSRASGTTSLPTTYTPPTTIDPAHYQSTQTTTSKSYVPSTPRFEPVVTGKVFVAGVVLAALIAGGIFLIALGL